MVRWRERGRMEKERGRGRREVCVSECGQTACVYVYVCVCVCVCGCVCNAFTNTAGFLLVKHEATLTNTQEVARGVLTVAIGAQQWALLTLIHVWNISQSAQVTHSTVSQSCQHNIYKRTGEISNGVKK